MAKGPNGRHHASLTNGPRTLPRLARQLWLDFYLGRVDVGTRLPSVRSIARDLGVSPTTVLDFYQALAAEGLVEGRPRSGVFLRRLGVEAERRPQEIALFELLGYVARRLPFLGISPARFSDLLMKRTGHAARRNFKFGFLSYRESFDLLHHQIKERLGFDVPIVPLIASSTDSAEAADRLRDDRTIRCVLTTYLYADRALDLARRFNRSVIVIRLKPAASAVLSPPATGKRYIVTRDRELANGFSRMICTVCVRERASPECGKTTTDIESTPPHVPTGCKRVCTASLEDNGSLSSILAEATHIYATPTALRETRKRCRALAKVHVLPTEVADETLDDILFHYLFAEGPAAHADGEGDLESANALRFGVEPAADA